MTPCGGCADPLGPGQVCTWSLCPEYGRAAVRTLPRAAALAPLDVRERRAWLELTAAAGAIIDIEIEHASAP